MYIIINRLHVTFDFQYADDMYTSTNSIMYMYNVTDICFLGSHEYRIA